MSIHSATPTPARRRLAAAAFIVVTTGGVAALGTASASATASAAPSTTALAGDPAAGPHHEMLQGILDRHHAAGDFVGAHIVLLEADGTLTEAAAGTVTLDPASAPVDPEVPWNVGSVTKTFVAVVVLQLAEEGRIDLDGGIERYFPDLPHAERITPRQLLQHTSGLNEYIDQPAVTGDRRRVWSPAELIAVAEAAGRVGQPGAGHHYANTNYIALGEIIEQATGHPWADEVRARIVEPLGLTHTGVIGGERPVGYVIVDGSFVDATFASDASIGGAAGELFSTARDLVRFARALLDGSLLSPASHAAMQTFVPAEDLSQFGVTHGYGLGVEQYVTDSITVLCHMGTGEAQSAFFGYDMERGSVVAVTTNTAVPGPQALIGVEALTAVAAGG